MNAVLHPILAAFRLLGLAVLTFFTVLIALPCFYLSKQSRRVSYATAKTWGRLALFILNVHVHLEGQLPKDKVLLMPNHQTFVDVFLVLGFFPASIVAKKEIGDWPILKSAIALGRIILVDRRTLKGSLKGMQDIDQEIKSGGSVILFPEGTTYGHPLTGAFKSGSFKIAEDTKTPIIPVAIKYLSRDMAWRNESFMVHFFQCMGFWCTDVRMWFGAPIEGLPHKALLEATKFTIDQQLSSIVKS